jgi:hypothetical protein
MGILIFKGLTARRLYKSFGVIGLRIKGLYMFRALLAHPQEVSTSGTWYIARMLYQFDAPGAAN